MPQPILILGISKSSPFGLGTNLSPHKCAMKKPPYTKYAVYSIPFSGLKSSAQSIKKAFLEVAYKKANLSKQQFSKIRNNPDYKPTKQTAIALVLALELDLEAAMDLIGRAGYALSNSSKFDLIIRYFIEQKNYSVVEVNLALYAFDQSLLGTQEK